MAKRIVQTIKIWMDTKDSTRYGVDVKGNALMPTDDLVTILRAVADNIEQSRSKTIEEHFKKSNTNG